MVRYALLFLLWCLGFVFDEIPIFIFTCCMIVLGAAFTAFSFLESERVDCPLVAFARCLLENPSLSLPLCNMVHFAMARMQFRGSHRVACLL